MKKKFFLMFFLIFLYAYNQSVGISESVFVPHSSAILELRSTTGGLLIPRMTTAQRNAITNPAHALLIYNTTSNCYEWWNANVGQWLSLGCECYIPQQPNVLPATNITSNSFHAQWSAVAGATGYYVDVSYNSTFTNLVPGYNNYDAGNNTWILLSGLPCNRNYYYRVRAYNSCGVSSNSSTIQVYVPCKGSCYTLGRSGDETGSAIVNTIDGGYLILGTTNSSGFGSTDDLIIKLDDNFNISWSKVVGGSSTEEDWGMVGVQLVDQNYLGVGHTLSFGSGQRDIFFFKFNPMGQRLWSFTVGNFSNDFIFGGGDVLNDGNFVCGGSANGVGAGMHDAFIIQIDNNGNVLASFAMGGFENDECRSICRTSDGGYIVAGSTRSFGAGNFDGYIAKFSSTNSLQWAKTYGGSGEDRITYVKQTSDLGFIAGGFTASYGAGSTDIWVMKLDGSGNVQWSRAIGGSASEDGGKITLSNDGGYIISGLTSSFGAGGQDGYVIKLTSSGSLAWTKTIGGTGNEYFQNGILNNSTGEYITVGTTNSFGSGGQDILLVRLDPNGNICSDCESGSGGIITSFTPSVTNISPTITNTGTKITGGSDNLFFSNFTVRCHY